MAAMARSSVLKANAEIDDISQQSSGMLSVNIIKVKEYS